LLELETLVNTLLTLPPTLVIPTMAATAINEAISVYSIAVAPLVFFKEIHHVTAPEKIIDIRRGCPLGIGFQRCWHGTAIRE